MELNFNLEPEIDTANLRIPCEVYSRIVGYMTPVGQWNDGKRQEFKERVVYAVPPALEHNAPPDLD